MEQIFKKRYLYIVAALGAIIYISLIWNNNLWMDEAFSAVLVRDVGFLEVLRASAADTLPPLYNILNWSAVKLLGFHGWSLRIMSILPMIGCIVLGLTAVNRRYGLKTALTFIICLWGMPWLLYYGVEIRMYALSLFFVTATGVYAAEYYYDQKLKDLLLLVLFTLGAGYTHHFAMVAAGFIWLLMFVACVIRYRKALRIILAGVALSILYIPCLIVTFKQMGRVSNYFSMPDVSAHFVIQCFKMPFTTEVTILSALLIAVYFIVILWTACIKRSFAGSFGLIIFLLVMTFGCVATKLFSANIFSERYLVPCFGLLWLGFAIALDQIDNKLCVAFALVLLIAVSIATYSIRFKAEYDPGVNKMTEYFGANVGADDKFIIYEDNYQIEICFRYYFPDMKKLKLEDLDNEKGSVWYLKVPGFEDKENELVQSGYSPEHVGDFNFDRYSFSLYKVK